MEGDWEIDCSEQCPSISIHSLRMEGDPKRAERLLAGLIFQSTPSAWRETVRQLSEEFRRLISIHSLRMEGDCRTVRAHCKDLYFNPLPPHGGRLT